MKKITGYIESNLGNRINLKDITYNGRLNGVDMVAAITEDGDVVTVQESSIRWTR